MTIKEMRAARAKMIANARALLDAASVAKRSMTDEENISYDTLFAEADELRSNIEREERQREAERELAENLESDEERHAAAGGDRGEARGRTDSVLVSFRSWLADGGAGESVREFRDLSTGVNTEGGYLVTPETFVAQLIKALDDTVIVRSMANVIPMSNAASIGIPSLDVDLGDADWTTELSTGSNDDEMRIGKRVMQPHAMAKRIKVSQQLLRVSTIPAEALVLQRLAYKFGVTQEKSYMIGDGSNKPLGLFAASASGIPVSRDISQGNSATEVTVDGLINAKYALKAGYWQKANWLFHRDIVKEIAKLKGSDGQFLWRESVRDGEPDTLLGRPIRMSEFAPNTMTTGQYVGMLGDFSHYWILDSMNLQIQRLTELYAETNQIGFIGRYEGDAAPVLPEAFARVTLG